MNKPTSFKTQADIYKYLLDKGTIYNCNCPARLYKLNRHGALIYADTGTRVKTGASFIHPCMWYRKA